MIYDIRTAAPVPAAPGNEKADALATQRSIAAGTIPARLLDLYERAARLSIRDSQGRQWPDLTDREAAALLTAEGDRAVFNTTVCAARNELRDRGLVGSLRKRVCRTPEGSEQRVHAYALVRFINSASGARFRTS